MWKNLVVSIKKDWERYSSKPATNGKESLRKKVITGKNSNKYWVIKLGENVEEKKIIKVNKSNNYSLSPL